MGRTPRLGALGLAIVLACAGASDAQSRGRPDLRAAAVSGGPQRLATGSDLMVRDRVVNRGGAASTRSAVSVYLVSHRRRVALERLSLARLGPGSFARHASSIRVPAKIAPGAYTIRVEPHFVAPGPPVGFALVVTGGPR